MARGSPLSSTLPPKKAGAALHDAAVGLHEDGNASVSPRSPLTTAETNPRRVFHPKKLSTAGGAYNIRQFN